MKHIEMTSSFLALTSQVIPQFGMIRRMSLLHYQQFITMMDYTDTVFVQHMPILIISSDLEESLALWTQGNLGILDPH